jgi:uncharacterized membrane protein
MHKRNILIVVRLFFSLLTFTAVGVQLMIHISHGYNIVNFFSYFTNLSNLFAAAVLLFLAVKSLLRQTPSLLEDRLRGASVTYMIVVGVVFTTLLRDVELGSLLPWVNTLLHYVMPVVVVADWLYDPARTKLSFKTIFIWFFFPLAYLVYSMARGVVTHFYAYPFLSPTQTGGYTTVSVYALCILLLFFIVGGLVILIGKRQGSESRN